MYLTLQGRGCRHFVHCSTEKPQPCLVAGVSSNGGKSAQRGKVREIRTVMDKRRSPTGSNVLISFLIVVLSSSRGISPSCHRENWIARRKCANLRNDSRKYVCLRGLEMGFHVHKVYKNTSLPLLSSHTQANSLIWLCVKADV